MKEVELQTWASRGNQYNIDPVSQKNSKKKKTTNKCWMKNYILGEIQVPEEGMAELH